MDAAACSCRLELNKITAAPEVSPNGLLCTGGIYKVLSSPANRGAGVAVKHVHGGLGRPGPLAPFCADAKDPSRAARAAYPPQASQCQLLLWLDMAQFGAQRTYLRTSRHALMQQCY